MLPFSGVSISKFFLRSQLPVIGRMEKIKSSIPTAAAAAAPSAALITLLLKHGQN